MRALKVLVIVLGVLLLGGTVALVLAVANRVAERRAAPPPPLPAGRPLATPLPAGSRIVAAELAGDRLMLRLALGDGGEEVLLIDARSGALVAIVGPSTKP